MQVIKLEPSKRRDKKYVADVIIDGILHTNVHFGSRDYQHYKDQTKWKLYKHLDHNDWDRKQAFHSRHRNNNGPAARLSKEFLW